MPESWKIVNSMFWVLRCLESALFAPKCVFLAPSVIPFINVIIWEVFWRPKTGKVWFYQIVMDSTPTTEIPSKYVFVIKSKISAKMQGNHKICYHLCFKHMSRLQTPLVLGPEDNNHTSDFLPLVKKSCKFTTFHHFCILLFTIFFAIQSGKFTAFTTFRFL